MLRILVFAGLLVSLISAFALYATSTDTRRLADEVDKKRRHKERLISSIAVLKAERAFQTRPAAIEPLARRLGMRPIRGRQYINRSDLPTLASKR